MALSTPYRRKPRQSRRKRARNRIEHAQVVDPADIPRFRRSASSLRMQPSHLLTDMNWAEARLGPKRAAYSYAWKAFLDAGVPLAFGTDYPVEPITPFRGLYAAVTRMNEAGNKDLLPAEQDHPRPGALRLHARLRLRRIRREAPKASSSPATTPTSSSSIAICLPSRLPHCCTPRFSKPGLPASRSLRPTCGSKLPTSKWLVSRARAALFRPEASNRKVVCSAASVRGVPGLLRTPKAPADRYTKKRRP